MHRLLTPRVAVGVWLLDPAGWDPRQFGTVLDAAESARAAALPERQSTAFVLGRALLRGSLSRHLGRPAPEVELRATCDACGGPHGRVRVLVPPADAAVHVSVTRAGPLVGIALTEAGPVGLDVESRAAVAAAPVADVVLSAAERAATRRLPRGAAPANLAETWVAKEAALKALGTGLRADPAGLELGLTGTGLAGTSRAGLTVARLPLGSQTVGAVAVASRRRGSGRATRQVRLDVTLHDGAAVLTGLGAG